MPRKRRFFLPGVPVHVVQRGNNRQAVFFDETDYRVYLDCLAEAAREHGCAIHAYVLMTNHIHLLTTPREAASLSLMLQSLYLALGGDRAECRAAYRELVSSRLDPKALDEVCSCLQTGTPLGDGRFRTGIETALGVKVGFSQRGRPRKSALAEGLDSDLECSDGF